jgi:hypothetical protein
MKWNLSTVTYEQKVRNNDIGIFCKVGEKKGINYRDSFVHISLFDDSAEKVSTMFEEEISCPQRML